MDYRDKLKAFNSTAKYRAELDFLSSLLKDDEGPILDFGCGIGTALEYLSERTEAIIRGYDIKCHLENAPNWFLEYPPHDQYTHVYFMHSIAHIRDIEKVLVALKGNLVDGGRITAITPNMDWINQVGNTNSDPTVIEHFTVQSINDLFTRCGYNVITVGQFGEPRGQFNERIFIQCSI